MLHSICGNGYKRHKDAIANFNKEYVKTEIFPREIGRRIADAGFDNRLLVHFIIGQWCGFFLKYSHTVYPHN